MRSKGPLIGITLSQAPKANYYRWPLVGEFDYLNKAYQYAVEKSGGYALGLFNTNSDAVINEYLSIVDGIVFTGGGDLNSRYFGQKRHPSCSQFIEPRDSFELRLIRRALKRKLPIFCICRGHQLLNIALGGNLYQDIKLFNNKSLKHTQVKSGVDSNHYVALQERGLLYKILKRRKIKVNSSHHQIVKNLGRKLKISATSGDGVIEAMEIPDYPFLLCVQWHPERIFQRAHSRELFAAFLAAAKNRN